MYLALRRGIDVIPQGAGVTMPLLQTLFVVAAGSSRIYAILQDK
jgi:hypothetical protein